MSGNGSHRREGKCGAQDDDGACQHLDNRMAKSLGLRYALFDGKSFFWRRPLRRGNKDETFEIGSAMRHVTLPNGIEIVEINKYETKFLYDEIFVQEAYGSYGIDIKRGGTIIDVGANIGMFALYMNERFEPGRILCFEPAPHCLEALKQNLAPLGDKVIISSMALGDKNGKVEFTYYPNYTIMSSMLADKSRDDRVLRAGARTEYERQSGSVAEDRLIDILVSNKLEDAQTFNCSVTTLSDTIEAHGLKQVSLVKIDVECAENAVLAGIRDEHWPLIDQLVVEVHDQGAREHEAMRDMLLAKGYQVQLRTELNLENSGIFQAIARR